MSNTLGGESVIGVRVYLKDGKIAAAEANVVSKSIKGIGDAAIDTDAKLKIANAGGLSLTSRAAKGIETSAAGAGGALMSLGTSGEKAGIAGSAAFTTFGSKLKSVQGDSKNLMGTMVSLGKYSFIGVVAGAAAAVYGVSKLVVGFNQATQDIAANADITSTAAKQIGQSFMSIAPESAASGTDIANAYATVAKQLSTVTGSALTTGQAFAFMRSGAILAEASGNSLNSSTSDLSQTLQSFHIALSGASNASNIMYNTSKLVNVSLDQLTTVESRLHSRLQQVMPSLSDMSGLLLDVGEHGAKGARGTMVVSSALGTLLGGGKGVTDMLAAMGLNVSQLFGPGGKFIGMSKAIDLIQPKLASLPQQLQLNAEKALFGGSAYQLMGSVVLSGSGAFDKATAAVNKNNAVQDAAKTRLQSVSGQWKVFVAEAKNFGVEVGQKVLPVLLAMGAWLLKHKPVVIAFGIVVGVFLVAAMIAAAAAAWIWAAGMLAATWEVLLIIAVIALVVFAVLLLVKHWRETWAQVKFWFDDAVKFLRSGFGTLGLLILGPVGILLLLILHWKQAWDVLKSIAHGAWNDFLKPIFDAMKTAIQDIIRLVKTVIGLPGKVLGAIGHFVGGVGGALGFADGGVVPGSSGAAVPAIVHAGELVIPTTSATQANTVLQALSTSSAQTPGTAPNLQYPTSTMTASQGTVPAQAIAGQAGGAGQPTVIQLVVDRKVLAQTVYSQMKQDVARQ
jgi:TP901 family phage tail tape measure protein